MSALATVPAGSGGPVLMGPANRCEVARCTDRAVVAISNALACTSRRVCEAHGGVALLSEALEPGEPARLTVVRLG